MIVDYLENLEIPDKEIERYFDARMALARLGEGLFWINREITKIELSITEEAKISDTKIAVVGGFLDNYPLGLVSCAFQWYAVSACNYAQLVGWLVTHDTIYAKEYVNRVMPRLLTYRNKVAAHFAITEPRNDNEADIASSVMTQIIFIFGRLFSTAFTPVVVTSGHEIHVSKDISWSLTLAHERLTPRYWPNGEPKNHQDFQIPPGKTTMNISWSDLTNEDK
jgi:hypothetical protein